MAEELRFFLRIALYTGFIGIVYWFISYEVAGSVLLGFVFAAAAAIVVMLVAAVGAAHRRPADLLGFTEHHGEAGALEIDEELIPPASIWPAVAGLAGLLIGLGLIYGAWFWVPGLAIALSAVHGWVTELR